MPESQPLSHPPGQPQSSKPDLAPLWVGLDVGGTKIDALAVDDRGAERGRARLATDTSSGDAAIQSIVRAVQAVLASAAGPDWPRAVRSAAIGLGIPGMVRGGVVEMAVHLNLTTFPLANYLSNMFGCPVLVENDVRAAALGAYAWVREARPLVRSLVFLSVGTGISAGVVIEGQIFRGENGMAGEVGHAVIDPNGIRCRCGTTGCLETAAAGWGIAEQGERAREAAARHGQPTRLTGVEPLTAAAVYHAAALGDDAALEVTAQVGRALSQAIYNLTMYYDVDVVALGGGVARAGETFFRPVRAGLERMAQASEVARTMLYGCRDGGAKVILLPPAADPAGRGVIALAKRAAYSS